MTLLKLRRVNKRLQGRLSTIKTTPSQLNYKTKLKKKDTELLNYDEVTKNFKAVASQGH